MKKPDRPRYYTPKKLEQFMMQNAKNGASFYSEMQTSHITSMARRTGRKVTTSQIIAWKRMLTDKEIPTAYRIIKVTFLNNPIKTQNKP